MRKLCLLIALTGSLASYQCSALTVNINRYGNYGQSPGGEFTVTLAASDAGDPVFQTILNSYDASTTVNGGFETFCISSTTGILGNPQDATLTPNGVVVGTAWLYSQFVKQAPALGYDYTPGAGRVASAWALQNAIWELQGTTVYDYTAAAGYFNMAVAFFGSAALAEVAANGAYGIDAMDLTYVNPNGGRVQSQPMLVAVPDGGVTAILLGLALGGIGLVSRKIRA
jgi:hypothetical protein